MSPHLFYPTHCPLTNCSVFRAMQPGQGQDFPQQYKQPGMPAVSVVTTVWGSVQAQPHITQTQGNAGYAPPAGQYMQTGIKRRLPGPYYQG